MVEAPREDRRKAAVRVLLEALAQGWPIAAGLAHIYRFTHPGEMERALEAWRADVTNAVNALEASQADHEKLLRAFEAHLSPRSQIGETALALAMWLAERSPDGLCNNVDFEVIRAEFADIAKDALEEACFELEHFGFVETFSAIGHAITDISIEYSLYWAFDVVVMKTDPLADARKLAEKLLENEAFGSVSRLDEEMSWSRRRLNPAVACLIPLIRIRSNEIQNQYPTRYFSIQSEDRFHLKQFIAEGG